MLHAEHADIVLQPCKLSRWIDGIITEQGNKKGAEDRIVLQPYGKSHGQCKDTPGSYFLPEHITARYFKGTVLFHGKPPVLYICNSVSFIIKKKPAAGNKRITP